MLTYQALCTLGAAATGRRRRAAPVPADQAGRRRGRVLSLLHPNGRALIARLQAGGPCTLVLDECHHLLELWGRLVQAVIEQLGHAPDRRADRDPAAPDDRRAGGAAPGALRPGRPRGADAGAGPGGRLAPYQELAYLTRPSPPRPTTSAASPSASPNCAPGCSTPTSRASRSWAGCRRGSWSGAVAGRGAQVSWARFENDEPALADAAVRLHVAGLLDLPEGARVREQHRHPPAAADWVALIGDYSQRCLLPSRATSRRWPRGDPGALPAARLPPARAGVRAGASPGRPGAGPVGEQGAGAAIEILRAESAELGARLRALVLCDFERRERHGARRTWPACSPGRQRRTRLVLETLVADPPTAALDPVLMTGRRARAAPERLAERPQKPAARGRARARTGGALGRPRRRSPARPGGSHAGTSRWSPGSTPRAAPAA